MVREILLGPEQFEVAFQITVQLREMPEGILNERGLTEPDLRLLIEVIGSIRGIAERCSSMRIDVVDALSVDPLDAFVADRDLSDGSSHLEAVGQLPIRIAEIWPSLFGVAGSWLGERELFLRTGYRMDSVCDVVNDIAGR